jgi:hypothetical protein
MSKPEEKSMVSAWWLLVALWLGACLGFLLSALLTVSKTASEQEEESQRRHARGLLHRHQ